MATSSLSYNTPVTVNDSAKETNSKLAIPSLSIFQDFCAAIR
jgi:hypothetical protein